MVRTRISTNLLVTYDLVVVGEVLWLNGGFVYRHYKFGMRPSSAMPTVEALLPHIDNYLKGLYNAIQNKSRS